MLGTVLLIVLLVLLIGGLPQFSGQWHSLGYTPSAVGLILVILLVVLLMGGKL